MNVCLLTIRIVLFIDDALYYLGETYLDEEKTTEALEVLNRLTSQYRDSTYLLPGIHLIGDIFMYQQKYAAAIQSYIYVLEQSTFSGSREEVMFKLGHAYRQNAQQEETVEQQRTQYNKAIEVYKTMLNDFPDSPNIPNIQLELAQTYFQIENYVRANQMFESIYKKEKKTSLEMMPSIGLRKRIFAWENSKKRKTRMKNS